MLTEQTSIPKVSIRELPLPLRILHSRNKTALFAAMTLFARGCAPELISSDQRTDNTPQIEATLEPNCYKGYDGVTCYGPSENTSYIGDADATMAIRWIEKTPTPPTGDN